MDGPEVREYVIADVFTDVPLQGNPVAVFTDGTGLSGALMQRLARELNLSETVFLLPPSDGGADARVRAGGADARVRIFTPGTELPFAGHPVLGTAFVVGGRLGRDTVRLETGAGIVPIRLTRRRDEVAFGEMEQPIPTWEPFREPDALLAALGVASAELPVEAYRNGPVHVFVGLTNEEHVAALRPDLNALAALGELGVGCFAGAGGSYKSRNFAPGLGVPEDPATGSAAGPLAVHLARHGQTAFGQQIEIRQGEEIGRPSILRACAEGSAERITRVRVGGSAVIVAGGEYRVQ